VVDCSHALQEKKTKQKQTKLSTATKRTKKTQHKKQAKAPKKAIKKKQPSKMTSSKASPARKRETPVRRAQRLESSGKEGLASARQSADLEGLSRVAQADSESVDELVEEGNTFPRFSPGSLISRSGAFETLLPLCGLPGIHRLKLPGC
jgi:hypothetical protein